ncbi:MAG TPA: aminoglycoside phosphotransferase family protein [Longimicrobium sp.]|nr:aminoglycoside phosphotransferase family protein [Longimicrobium sp.]
MTGDASEATWRTEHRAIVLDCAVVRRPRVLVVPAADGAGLALPAWVVDEGCEHDPDVGRFAAQARERLGVEVVVLHYREPSEDEAARARSGTWVLEARGPLDGAPGALPEAEWVRRGELARLTDPDERRLAEEVARQLENGVSPPGRCAWAAPGWLDEAASWMVARLAALGRPAVGPIAQFRSNSISSVVRAPTRRGDVYLKAACRHFRTEARITQGLAAQFPEHVPVVLAADVERSWLLMEDFGPSLRRVGPTREWERALCLMGELQRRCVDQTDWLFAIGAADRRLSVLRTQVTALLEAPETRRELDADALANLVARTPELEGACDALAACGVPETLIHGDLHAGNVALRDGRIALFDWTDAAVAHPFLDLITFLPNRRRRPVDADDPDAAAQRLLDAYLEGWTTFASPTQLRRAVDLLQTVQALHHAQSYLQILRSIEPADHWQWQGELGEWLAPLVERTRTDGNWRNRNRAGSGAATTIAACGQR